MPFQCRIITKKTVSGLMDDKIEKLATNCHYDLFSGTVRIDNAMIEHSTYTVGHE